MDVEVRQASLEQKPILKKLLSIYLPELHETDDKVDTGAAGYKYLDLYWQEIRRVPFLIYLDGTLAGFVLVNEYVVLDENIGAKAIAEFFILQEYRNKDVGERAAVIVFNKFPGRWEVVASDKNLAAQKFWDKVINKYADGKFSKIIVNNEKHQGPVYTFSSDA